MDTLGYLSGFIKLIFFSNETSPYGGYVGMGKGLR